MDAQDAVNMLDDAAQSVGVELRRLEHIRETLVTALRVIATDSDVSADFPNGVVRLRGIHARAEGVLAEELALREALDEDLEERGVIPSPF